MYAKHDTAADGGAVAPGRIRAPRVRTILTATAAALTLGAMTPATAFAQAPSDAPAPAPAPPSNGEAVSYTVEPGDSLTKIGRKFGLMGDSDWRRLYDANLGVLHPDLLAVGQVLTIPAPDAVLEQRALPLPPPPREPVRAERSQRSGSSQRAAAPRARSAAPAAASSTSGGVWDQLAQCESGGNWGINTGNGYHGGLQFSQSSWQAVGGSGSAANASREEQIARAEQLKASQGWGAWPACSRKLGLR